MIELQNDRLVFSFPEVHKNAVMNIEIQRTLRIADDGDTHYLPPGLGRFPLSHVDDFTDNLPPTWAEHGGVFMPMYQSEALWFNFHCGDYPFAIKIAAGKVNALTGGDWSNELSLSTQNGEVIQDYLVVPGQPWLDGFAVEKGVIRQFVAMPLGEGYTAEEQITEKAEHGGIQIICYPLKREFYRPIERFSGPKECRDFELESDDMEMGLGLGGRMKQEIFKDKHGLDAWDTANSSRCFVHIANSAQYFSITNSTPPTQPPTAEQYTKAGLPWFDYYDESQVAQVGSEILSTVESIDTIKSDASKRIEPEPTLIVITPEDKKKVRSGVF